MMVAVPVWQGRVSPVFDTALRLHCVDVEAGVINYRQEVRLEATAPYERARQVRQIGVDVLICGGISMPLGRMLRLEGVEVIPFVAGEIDEVLKAYSTGKMNDSVFAMPGCRGRQRRRRRRG